MIPTQLRVPRVVSPAAATVPICTSVSCTKRLDELGREPAVRLQTLVVAAKAMILLHTVFTAF